MGVVGSTRLVASYQNAVDRLTETGKMLDALKESLDFHGMFSSNQVKAVWNNFHSALLEEREALIDFAEASEADWKEEFQMKCPSCGATDYRDMGFHPHNGETAHILLCRNKDCGEYYAVETHYTKIVDPKLRQHLLLEEKDIQTAP